METIQKQKGRPIEELFVNTNVPSWLQPPKTDHTEFYTEWTWEEILIRLSSGESLTNICRDETMPQDVNRLRRWIFNEPDRKALYYKAQEIGTEQLVEKGMDIADALDNPMEDVQRSTLRVNYIKWLVGARNRARFGDIKQVEQTVNINISEAMNKADLRVINGRAGNLTLEHDDD